MSFWPFGKKEKSLQEALFETKIVFVHGVRWKIRKVSPIDFVRGARVHRAFFETYSKSSVEQQAEMLDKNAEEKIKDHFRDTFMSCVTEPKLCYAKDKEKTPEAICVDNLFTDWDLVNELYEEIVLHSFGKKKPT